MNRGKYIVIEGAEGVGKTTMVLKVADTLQKAGLSVRIMREPDSQNDLTARAIRHLTQDPRYPMNTRTEVLLYNAARSQSLETIRTARDNGVICLVDRSYLTTLAIQYYGRGDVQDYTKINEIIDFAVGDMQPDLMLVLDAPVDTLKSRTRERYSGDRFDSLDAAFLERVRAGYLWEARQRELPVIYATGDVDEVFKQVWAHVTKTLAIRDKENPTSKPTSVADVIASKHTTVATSTASDPILSSSEVAPALETTPSETLAQALATPNEEYILPANLPASLKKDFRKAFDAISDVRKTIASQLRNYALEQHLGNDAEKEILEVLSTLSQQQLTVTANSSQAFNKQAYEVLSSTHGDSTDAVSVVSYTPHNELDCVSDMLYQHSDMTKQAIKTTLQNVGYDTKATLFEEYCKGGQLDAFQNVSYELDILSSGASFAELTSQTICEQVMPQRPTPRYGYDTPAIIDAAGLSDMYATCFEISLQLYSIIQKLGDSRIATSATLLGHNLRWNMTVRASQLPELVKFATTTSRATQRLISSIVEQISSLHPLIAAQLTKTT